MVYAQSFNLSILECKFRQQIYNIEFIPLLISPYWNVNCKHDWLLVNVVVTFNLSILECK